MGIPSEISADINGSSKKTKMDGFGKMQSLQSLVNCILQS